ncbi:MAG TPA: IS1380 family transposase [Ktedonobacteraceae bacterium]|nr:IS1380 family transposase [Ktedonobacteraceae bacterium]
MSKDTSLSLGFPAIVGKEVIARFDGGDITSDAGALLLAQADKKTGLIDAMAKEILDDRQAAKVRHPLATLLRQRVIAIACGYEDANDFDTLAADPALKIACRRAPESGPDLASQPTVSRLENRVNRKDIYCMACAIARQVVAQLPRKTTRVVIDLDAYEDPCHGQQEFEFFNAHYDSHCYLPLAVFITAKDGVQRLMGAMLRSGRAGNAGVRAIIRLAVDIIRERFPKAKIILRADAGFGNAAVLHLCDRLKISYCLGLASNKRLEALAFHTQMQASLRYTFSKEQWVKEGVCRLFKRLEYKADKWKRQHPVILKTEVTRGVLNPRYIVTDQHKTSPKKAYAFYCGRGDAENRIKEFKLNLFAGRTSCHRFLANQFRLLLHVAASVLMSAIQVAAKTTEFAKAQAGTLRLRLLKVGARVVETTRRVWLHLSSSYPNQSAWRTIHAALGP